jgi:phosphoribosylanthranilate isomerase
MKAVPIERAADLAALTDYVEVADRILFDARPPKGATRPGGLGTAFDWHVLENLDLKLPFMVSGGLHAGNVAEAMRVTRPSGVDVSSGVERAPGIKDIEMICDFIRAARASDLTSPPPVSGERSDRASDPGEGDFPLSRSMNCPNPLPARGEREHSSRIVPADLPRLDTRYRPCPA